MDIEKNNSFSEEKYSNNNNLIQNNINFTEENSQILF